MIDELLVLLGAADLKELIFITIIYIFVGLVSVSIYNDDKDDPKSIKQYYWQTFIQILILLFWPVCGAIAVVGIIIAICILIIGFPFTIVADKFNERKKLKEKLKRKEHG